MRDLLTGLAIILIVALTTALVAPYLVDWNSQRAFLEARLSHALGQKVTIGGNIDLKLLPTPYLVLDQTVVGDDEAPIRMGIHHLNLELAVTPLLHGEFDIVQAQLREPTLRMTLQPDRSLPALPTAPAYAADLRFDRIEIDDGIIAIADPSSGRTFVVDNLDMTADAPSLAGPFKGTGAAGLGSSRTKFRFATTAAQGGRGHAHLVVEETPAHVGVDLDGLVTFARVDGNAARPDFDGTVALSGHLAEIGSSALAWRLAGPFKVDPQHARLDGAELRLGNEDAGLSLQATGSADLGDTAKLALSLTAKQLDIDRLSGAPTDQPRPPPQLPDLATLRRLLASPLVPLDVDLAVETATYGGETLSDLSAHLSLGTKGPRAIKIAGEGPGGAHLALDGRLAADRSDTFDGTFAFAADSLPTTAAWLATIAPDLGVKRDDVPFDSVKASGTIAAGPTGVAATKLALTLDRSDLTGTAHFSPAVEQKPAALAADVTARALDLDALPSLDSLRGSATPLDLDLKLDANAIKVSRIGDGTLDAGHLRLALTKTGRHLTVTTFRADDLGGATIAGTGSIDPDKATLSATLDGAQLAATTDLLRRLAPGRLADAIADRASALAPAKLKIDARFATNDKGALEATRLDLGGRLAATAVDAHLAPGSDQNGTLSLNATMDAPEGAAMLAQFGFQTLPLDLLGHSHVAVAANGRAGQPLQTKIDGRFGATSVSVDGRFEWLGAARGGSGQVALKSDDISPLLQSLAVAFPDMTGRLPVDMTGGVAVAQDGLALSDLNGTVAGVDTKGALKWQRASGDHPVLTGGLDVDRLTLGSLLGLSLGPFQPPAADSAFSTTPFAAGLVDPPRTALKLKARALDLAGGRTAADAGFDLEIAPNLMVVRGLDAKLDKGRISADLTLRRDGNQAAIEGKIGADGVDLGLRGIHGALTGQLDIAGSGASPATLVASLAGSGEASLAHTSVPLADPKALPTVFDAVEADEVAVDADSVVRAYDAAATGPLDAGNRGFHLGLAGGTLNLEAADASVVTGDVASDIGASLDLRRAALAVTTTETLRGVPKGWTGPLPAIAIVWSGPLATPQRTVDAGDFLNAVAARALARESAKLEAYEFDIRERAFFNARLQSETRRDDDRAKAEDDARKAEAARIAAKKAAEQRAAEQRAAEQRALDGFSAAPGPGQPPAPPSPQDPRRFETPPPGAAADPSAAGRY